MIADVAHHIASVSPVDSYATLRLLSCDFREGISLALRSGYEEDLRRMLKAMRIRFDVSESKWTKTLLRYASARAEAEELPAPHTNPQRLPTRVRIDLGVCLGRMPTATTVDVKVTLVLA